MDRYITRKQKVGPEYPEGNQMIAFSATSTGNNITIPENLYYNTYSGGMQNSDVQYNMAGPSTMVPQMRMFTPNVIQPQIAAGINPRYLAAYSDANVAYIAAGQHVVASNNPVTLNPYSCDYENSNMIATERTENRFAPQRISNVPTAASFNAPPTFQQRDSIAGNIQIAQSSYEVKAPALVPFKTPTKPLQKNSSTGNVQIVQNFKVQKNNEGPPKKQMKTDSLKTEVEVKNKVKSRTEMIKELYQTGTRVFSGNVESVLKLHKMIQDNVGAGMVMILYEIVGKCISVSGESCAKILVVRDDSGPAMQVVYYEIDFLMPELKPPCIVRVIGRIMMGSNRLHAFSVRAATGDDVAISPRRAAVAAHQVVKLCKEYSNKII